MNKYKKSEIISFAHQILKSSLFRALCLSVLCFFVMLSVTLSFSSAENFTLYSSIGTNDTITKNLIAIYQNSPNYDPFNEFEVARVGQYDYRLFYGKDIDNGDYKYFQYQGILSTHGVNYIYTGGEGNNLYLDKQGYITVGNVENSLKSSDAENYKFQFVVISILILLVVVVLFKIFKISYKGRSDRGWQL